jgi:hypothetical protein
MTTWWSSRVDSQDTSHKLPESEHNLPVFLMAPLCSDQQYNKSSNFKGSPVGDSENLLPTSAVDTDTPRVLRVHDFQNSPCRLATSSKNQSSQAYPPAHPWSIRISHSFKQGCGRRFRQVLRAEEDFVTGPDLCATGLISPVVVLWRLHPPPTLCNTNILSGRKHRL